LAIEKNYNENVIPFAAIQTGAKKKLREETASEKQKRKTFFFEREKSIGLND
jgi:hypothetical protein